MINRKLSTPQNLEAIFEIMKSGIRERGGRIQDIFYCPMPLRRGACAENLHPE